MKNLKKERLSKIEKILRELEEEEYIEYSNNNLTNTNTTFEKNNNTRNKSLTKSFTQGGKNNNSRLHSEYMSKNKIKEEYDNRLIKEYKKKSNKEKINPNSLNILQKKIEDYFTITLMKIDKDNIGKINYTQLITFINKIKLKHEDNIMHNLIVKHIWKYLTGDDSHIMLIEIDLVYAFFRIIYDLNKITVHQIISLIKQFLRDRGINIINLKTDIENNILSLKDLIKIIKNIRKPEYLIIKNTKKIKESTMNDIININSNITHKPNITNKSQDLSRIHKDKHNIPYDNDIVDTLYLKNNIKNNNLEKLKQINKNKIKKECPFFPNNVNYDNRNNSKIIKNLNNRLNYNNKDKYKELSEIKKEIDTAKLEEDIKNCTFKPNTIILNTNIYNNYNTIEKPKNYEKNIQRIRSAYKSQQQRKKIIDDLPRALNYEKLYSNYVVNPPLVSYNIPRYTKNKPFMYLEIKLNSNKTGKLGICYNDNPKEKARNFCKTFQLGPEVEKGLSDLIKQHLKSHK